MAPRPFCLVLQYSYPFELQPVARCRCWRDQPRRRDPYRLSGSYSPNPTSAGTSIPASRRTWTHTGTHSPLRRCGATTGEGHEDTFLGAVWGLVGIEGGVVSGC